MSGELVSVPVPVCEVCWISSRSTWEPESVDENGHMLVSLVHVEMPKKYNLDEPELCNRCGSMTVSGIFETAPGSSLKWSSKESLAKVSGADVESEDYWTEPYEDEEEL